MNLKNLLYALSCLGFSIIAGAATYEHIAVWPHAFAAPPASLTMFQGEYGLNSGNFWPNIHPVVLLLFVISLILHWKTDRKKYVLYTLIGYVIIMVVTFIYFVPELIAITQTPFAETVDSDLVRRGSTWELLSIIRMIIIYGLAVFLYLGLTKTGEGAK